MALGVTELCFASPLLPPGFHGFRVAQISDLHNRVFGPENRVLLQALRQAAPDVIAITGDLVDSRRPDRAAALDLCRRAAQLAPCYYVPGNHEARLPDYDVFRQQLLDAGVTLLEDRWTALSRGDERLFLLGLRDPAFSREMPQVALARALEPQIAVCPGFRLLLSHRPEYFPLYSAMGATLTLSGHAHGGQFRLPFLGGLFAPGQGLLPAYDAGLYTQGNRAMIVSRGLGNSAFPFRLGNPPELVVVTL